jgi:hypothetical protein
MDATSLAVRARLFNISEAKQKWKGCHHTNVFSSWQHVSAQIWVIFEERARFSFDEFEVEVILRPTVSRPVYLDVRHPSGTRDQFFCLLEISLRQLRVCYFVAPSLTRGRVSNLLYNCFWALPEQSLLGPSPVELRPYFIVSSETPPTWRARACYRDSCPCCCGDQFLSLNRVCIC